MSKFLSKMSSIYFQSLFPYLRVLLILSVQWLETIYPRQLIKSILQQYSVFPICRRAESLQPGRCCVCPAPLGDVSGVPGLSSRHVELLLKLSRLLQRQRTVQGRSLQSLPILLWRIFRWVCYCYAHSWSTYYKRQRKPYCQHQYNIIYNT